MMMNKLNLKSGISARQMAVRPARCMRVSAQKKPEVPVVPETGVEKAPYVDQSGFKFGFSRDNELQVGRAAMLGFASSLLGEILTGKGALAQFGYELEINNLQQDELLVLAIVVLPPILSVILPKSQRFIPETSLSGRTPGSLQDPSINLTNPKQFFGITEFGWSKQNELFVGRVAQLGFAASIIGEAITGKGPLAQFDFETGVPLVDTEFGLVVFIAFFVFAAINQGSGKFVEVDSEEGTGTTEV